MTGPSDPNVDATGLQAERTQLAWVRTALAAGALAAVATRLTGGGPSLVPAVVFGLVVAMPGVAAAWARIRALARQRVPRAAAPWTVALLATSLALADALALVLLAA
ncbi:MAG: DUF202 domain-containing protein [Acidimicrobiales bacterium]